MSSTYSILCLSHDPATVHGDYLTPGAAETALADGLTAHPHCDLAIGRTSGALAEVGCPPTRHQPASLTCSHGSTVWADTEWLRLLAAAQQTTDPVVQAAVSRLRKPCWTRERLKRLRIELQLQDQPVREVSDAEQAIRQVRKAIAERRAEVAEYEAENPPSSWSDAVANTCNRIDDALRVFPPPRRDPR